MTDQWGRPLTGPECKALVLPSEVVVGYKRLDGSVAVATAAFWEFSNALPVYVLYPNSAAYIVADWNHDYPDQPPFRYWAGGEEAPGDWDHTNVLLRDGSLWGGPFFSGNASRWRRAGGQSDCVGYRTRIPAETTLGALVDSCFADLGDAEPFVVERKEQFLGPRHGTATGGCLQLSAWLRTNLDHPVVADFLAETAKKSGAEHSAESDDRHD